MKTLLLCIGDLHLEYQKSISGEKFRDFKRFLKSIFLEDRSIVFLVNGDIVNKGSDQEFCIAADFFSEIEEIFTSSDSEGMISFIFSPGNHDCDVSLTSEQMKRLCELKDAVKINELRDLIASYNTQKNYEEFKSLFPNLKYDEDSIHSSFLDIYRYSMGNLKMNVVSLNSSFMFNLDTKQGDIYIDYDNVMNQLLLDKDTINILVTHYPVEWYDRNNLKKLDEMNAQFQIRVYGHEHFGNVIEQKINNLSPTYELRTPPFNLSSALRGTGLGVIEIDDSEEEISISIIEYNGSEYLTTDKKIKINNGVMHKSTFVGNICEIKDDYLKEIEIIDRNVIGKDKVLLLDFYEDLPLKSLNDAEFQDELEKDFEYEKVYVKSSNIDMVSNFTGFYGDMDSGKTTWLKVQYLKNYNSKKIPILIDGELLNRKLSNRDYNRIVEERYINQYVSSTDYLNLYREDVVLLIDDLHRISSIEFKISLFEFIETVPYTVCFTSNSNYSQSDSEINSNRELLQYKILDFGQTELYSLTEKWLKIHNLDLSADYLKKKINVLSRNKYVPKTPFFIVMLLRADFENNISDLVDSKKKVYYQYLISKLILETSSELKMNDEEIDNRLEELSYYIYSSKDSNSYKGFVAYLKENYEHISDEEIEKIRLLKNYLLSKKVLYKIGDSMYYRYPFMYYTYLSRFLVKYSDENLLDFKEIIKNLHKDENSNLLIFLSQYFAMNTITKIFVEEANNLYSEYKEIDFNEKDLFSYNRYISGVKELESEGTLKENNKRLNENIDKRDRLLPNLHNMQNEYVLNEKFGENANNYKEELDKISKGFNMLQIFNELLSKTIRSNVSNNLIKSAVSLGRRFLSQYTESYEIGLLESIDEHINSPEDISNDDVLGVIKSATNIFNGIFFTASISLGKLENINALINLFSSDDFYIEMMKFVINIEKNSDEDKRIDVLKIQELLKHTDNSNNKLCKGLVIALVSHQLNYIGLGQKKIHDVCNIFNISRESKIKLLKIRNSLY